MFPVPVCKQVFAGIFVGASVALGAPTVTITTAAPAHAGSVSLQFFVCADANCRHGVQCNVGPIAILAGITAAQKAALIEAAIDAKVGCGVDVARVGNTLTITSSPPNNDGVKCDKAKDSTGEIMLVDNDSTGVPVDYTTCAKLEGTPSSGNASLGENGVSHSTTTSGKTIPQIYAAWQSAFGEGAIVNDRFCLPQRNDETSHGFDYEVTDASLAVTVEQHLVGSILVPTVSNWGICVMVLLLLSAATVVVRHRQEAVVS